MSDGVVHFTSAINDFRRARRQAKVQEALSLLSGANTELLPYEEVRRKLRAVESGGRELREIPLDAIVGSVGRYNDFTRGFLPRQDSDEQRWANVKVAMTGLSGLPAIEVYQIGDAYFVKDGNHRVSVARQLGAKYIQAYVTRVNTRVSLTPDTKPDELILKAEYADFLTRTRLDELRPQADLTVTAPGQYDVLCEHIDVHRYYMGLDQQRDIAPEEAVAHWYDTVYLPIAKSILANGLLHGFAGRTVTDLYLWLAEHRAKLERDLGWSIPSESIAATLKGGPRLPPERRAEVLSSVGANAATGNERAPSLIDDILVAVAGDEVGWLALEQAVIVAGREGARLYGLHVLPEQAATESPEARAVRERFLTRCGEAGVPAQFAFAFGRVVDRILERARWTDLVVANLVYPPDEISLRDPVASFANRLASAYQHLLRGCPRPLLALPGKISPFERPLLAYDASARSNEALFAAGYLAAKWRVPLVVTTVLEFGRTSSRTLERARDYLEPFGIDATYVEESGSVADAIIETLEAHGCDSVLLGSYSYNRWLESVLGGVLEQVMIRGERPVLVT